MKRWQLAAACCALLTCACVTRDAYVVLKMPPPTHPPCAGGPPDQCGQAIASVVNRWVADIPWRPGAAIAPRVPLLPGMRVTVSLTPANGPVAEYVLIVPGKCDPTECEVPSREAALVPLQGLPAIREIVNVNAEPSTVSLDLLLSGVVFTDVSRPPCKDAPEEECVYGVSAQRLAEGISPEVAQLRLTFAKFSPPTNTRADDVRCVGPTPCVPGRVSAELPVFVQGECRSAKPQSILVPLGYSVEQLEKARGENVVALRRSKRWICAEHKYIGKDFHADVVESRTNCSVSMIQLPDLDEKEDPRITFRFREKRWSSRGAELELVLPPSAKARLAVMHGDVLIAQPQERVQGSTAP